MTPILMPDPEAQQALGLPYEQMRRIWISEVLKLKRLGKRKKPEPATVDGADPELG